VHDIDDPDSDIEWALRSSTQGNHGALRAGLKDFNNRRSPPARLRSDGGSPGHLCPPMPRLEPPTPHARRGFNPVQCAEIALIVDGEARLAFGFGAQAPRCERLRRPIVIVEPLCVDRVDAVRVVLHLFHLPNTDSPSIRMARGFRVERNVATRARKSRSARSGASCPR
jgi:hypothetical protein